MTQGHQPVVPADKLYQDIRLLIESARKRVVAQVNQALVLTYWRIGKTIKTEVLDDGRAQYGAAVLKQLAQRLTYEYGNGFSYSGLTRMAKFYSAIPTQEIVATLSQQLSWSHFVEIIKISDAVKREFYIRMAVEGRWSVRTLRERMDGMLFERTAISKQPDALIRQELTQPQQQPSDASPALFLKDPYLLDFLDLKDNFSEKDLENAITPYYWNWSGSFSNWAATSPSWVARNASRSALTTTISICSSITANSDGWFSSN